MRPHGCQSDLVVRDHRSLLPNSARLALDAHLADCPACRLDQQILADFDDEGAVDTRDGARIEGLSAVARTWAVARQPGVEKHRPSGQASRIWTAAAALLLLAGAAGATTWWTRRTATPEAKTAPPNASQAAIPTGRPTREPPSEMPVAAEPALVPRLHEPSARPSPPAHEPRAPRTAKQAGGSDAALLLRQAGNARRDGNQEHAVELYRRLQRDFPGTPEALLSTVSLANLRLEQGALRSALTGFDRYLRAAPDGVLVPEALYGRARTLAALGDRNEEQRTWQRLLRDFPTSAYAPLARRRATDQP